MIGISVRRLIIRLTPIQWLCYHFRDFYTLFWHICSVSVSYNYSNTQVAGCDLLSSKCSRLVTVNSNTLSTSIFHYPKRLQKFLQLCGSYIFAPCWQITFKFGNLTDIKTLFPVVWTDFPLCQKLNPFITASADGFTLVKYVLLLLLLRTENLRA